MAAKESSLIFLLMLAVTLADNPKKVYVSTRYITTAPTTLLQKEKQIFIATLCSRFQETSVNATMLLNNNPSWDPLSGVVDYYIVDSSTKSRNDSLCNNTDSSGKRSPNCYIKKWGSSNDLYLVATAGEVDSISFAIDIEFKPLMSPTRNEDHTGRPSRWFEHHAQKVSSRYGQDMITLSEIVNVRTEEPLAYKKTALLNVTFCKNSQTSNNYKITSSVFGTDGKSSYTQYLCSDLPCEVDGKTVIGFEGKQLPNNNVYLTTTAGEYQQFYVLVVCWGGVYDANVKTYIGHFQYYGQIEKIPSKF